jgi:alcohol dehydrogenase class IV
MDVAKLTAFLSHADCEQSLSDIYGVSMCKGARLPLVQVPTTAGTGSEVTPISIIVSADGSNKKGVVSQQLYADATILGEFACSLSLFLSLAHTIIPSFSCLFSRAQMLI